MPEEEEVKEEAGKKYVTATLDVEEDAELIKKYTLVRNVGGMNNKALLSIAVDSYMVSDDFKDKVRILQAALRK